MGHDCYSIRSNSCGSYSLAWLEQMLFCIATNIIARKYGKFSE